METIESLKSKTPVHDLTASPRKCIKVLRCAVLTRSELKESSSGKKSFSITLCDRDPSSTLKAVCFHEDYYSQLEPTKTYILKKLLIKERPWCAVAPNSYRY